MGAIVVLPIGIALLLAFLCCETNACREAEGVALLKLKHSFTDPLHQLSSWKEGTDCCMSWAGVRCHNRTGHVVRLKLSNMFLGGKISPSLIQLNHLRSIDLSLNDFGGARIPGFIGSLTKMTYLDLSSANFSGNLPHQLGNLSSLNYLDLGSVYIIPYPGLETNSLAWISNLSNLRYLSMDMVNLMNATDWLLEINKLTSLTVLKLSSCQIPIPISPPFFNLTSLFVIDLSENIMFNSTFLPPWLFNMTSLTYLDLSSNSLIGPIPEALWNMNSLTYLDLRLNGFSGPIPEAFRNLISLNHIDLDFNTFTGPIPEVFGNMTSLTYLTLQYNLLGGDIPKSMGNLCSLQVLALTGNNFIGEMAGLVDGLSRCYPNPAPNLTLLDLSHNSFTGSIPQSLGTLTSLQSLYLKYNKLNGTLPEWLGQLSELTDLDVSSNSLVGDVSEAHFAKLSRLEAVSLSHNSLTSAVSPNWVPPFQLGQIFMSSCQLGTLFPPWLQTQKGLSYIDFSNAGISDTMPYWFWNLTSQIVYLNISHNQITGSLPVSLESIAIAVMDFSSNLLEGPLPRLNSNIEQLYLFENSFSGSLPSDMGQAMPHLSFLRLSSNLFNGSIPHSFCDMLFLNVLDLSDNRLSGELPRCWNGLQKVRVLNMGHNMLSGHIPESMGSMFSLKSLHLNNNSFTGEIPLSLKNCTSLVALNLGENNLSGNIPSWLGESLLKLKFLRLRSNMFRGKIPTELSLLTTLQLLDIANNSLSGSIPPSLGSMTGMHKNDQISNNYGIDEILTPWSTSYMNTQSIYEDNMVVYIEGRDLQYNTTLALVMSIDLSINKLSGEIPEELTNLSGLIFLNLAHNMLTGRIPKGIGNLRLLLMLDLSINKLTGVIPQGISALMSLNHLNLSYNNLSGIIPSGSQLQVLNDPYIYIGNGYLCGFPLTVRCTYDKSPSMEIGGSDEVESDAIWFYSSIGPGFAAGILGLWSVLVFKTSWRFSLFRLIDRYI